MIIENRPQEGYIYMEIEAKDFENLPNPAFQGIRIKRRVNDSGDTAITLKEFEIEDSTDFSFSIYDLLGKSGTTYTYYILPLIGTGDSATEGLGLVEEITAKLNGVFITDGDEWYYSDLNAKVEFERSYSVSYVTPYYSKYPHAIQTGYGNYNHGSCSALWLPKDNTNHYTKEGCDDYKEAFIDFLTNGEKKVLKDRQGHIWCISIDEDITGYADDYIADGEVSFNWTEIGEVPYEDMGIVVVA